MNIDLVAAAIGFGVLLLSLTIHEAAHAWSADKLGDPTARMLGRVSLNPLVHIDWIGTVLLPIIAIVPVAEILSVILQVSYFKLTKGQRLLRMSPLHHHFELGGWSETQIVQRFWLVGLLSAMVGVALALI